MRNISLSRTDGERFWDSLLVSYSPEVSSHQQMFCRKLFWKICKIHGKLLWWGPFLLTLEASLSISLKNRLHRKDFGVSSVRFFRVALLWRASITKWKGLDTGLILVNLHHVTDLFLYPLKTSENQTFSDIFRGYRKSTVTWNRLMTFNKFTI